MVNFEHIDSKTNSEEKIIYALGKLGNLGYLQIFLEDDFNEDLEELLKKHKLEDIFIKSQKTWLKDKLRTTQFELEEKGCKIFIDLSLEDIGLDLYQRKARELIRDNSINKNVLSVLGHNGEYSITASNKAQMVTTHILSDDGINKNLKLNLENIPIQNLKNNLMNERLENFIDMLAQTKEEYDLIILDLSDYNINNLENFDIQKEHATIIKSLQEKNLTPGGALIFITNVKGFVLDSYIRPGADKLTKKTNENKSLKLNHSYAFYN